MANVGPSLNLGPDNAAGISYEKFIRTIGLFDTFCWQRSRFRAYSGRSSPAFVGPFGHAVALLDICHTAVVVPQRFPPNTGSLGSAARGVRL